ncbi:hypothetical protein DH09_06550 [Bacillaceae bacterium JMAK1]|nr:hypothetical protein DH09_06550 [Bacillaceae bacterium JMAK1]
MMVSRAIQHGFEQLLMGQNEVYLVGGAVRDMILNKESADFDFVTTEPLDELCKRVKRATYIHTKQPLVRMNSPYGVFEVSELKGRLYDNLLARDFTMNACALDSLGVVMDPFCGRAALEEGELQTVRPTSLREDPLRVLRAIRFSIEYGLTLTTIRQEMDGAKASIQQVAKERIGKEVERAIMSDSWLAIFEQLCEERLLLAFTSCSKLDVATVDLQNPLSQKERWLVLHQLLGIEKVGFPYKTWGYGKGYHKKVSQLLQLVNRRVERMPTDVELFTEGLADHLTVENVHRAITVRDPAKHDQLMSRFEQLPIQSFRDLAVTPKHLIDELNVQPGPWIQRVMHMLVLFVLKREVVNDKKILLHKARELYDETSIT